jgi:magnesium chelatase subunit I
VVDKRSGVSQRLPISTMELVVSNAERRALVNREPLVLPRVSDIYAALPGMTGKLELEYEGEMRGADSVVRDLIRSAIGKIYDRFFADVDTQQIEEWFNLGGTVKLDDNHAAADALANLKQIQGLMERLAPLHAKKSDPAPKLVSAAEFLLEGMVAHRKLSRSEERVFASAQQQAPRRQERAEVEVDYEEWQRARHTPKSGYN